MAKESDSIGKIRQGEIEDLKTFFENFYPQACRLAQKYLNDKYLSQDMAQDSFLGFWMKKEEFTTMDAAKNYIYTSVKNRCLNYLRDTKKLSPKEVESFEKGSFFRDAVVENETYQLFYEAIGTLSPQSQRIIEFSLDGLKNAAIARELGITVNTVKTIKLRAFDFLRKKLNKNILIAFLFFR